MAKDDGYTFSAIFFSFVMIGADLAYNARDYLALSLGKFDLANKIGGMLGGFYAGTPYIVKLICFALLFFSLMVMTGTPPHESWKSILIKMGVTVLLFFFPRLGRGPFYDIIYLSTTLLGYACMIIFFPPFCRKLFSLISFKHENNKGFDTFAQETELIANDDSVNIPIKFHYQNKIRKGWINIVAPFRGTMVLGTPGSGKSFSIFSPMITQMTKKDYTFLLYDYKYPTLTEELYYEYMKKYGDKLKAKAQAIKEGKPFNEVFPEFCVVNYNDPRYSMRVNPLDPQYIRETADAVEVADLIMRNIDPEGAAKKDFFFQSACSFLASCIWMLRCYKDGIYCTFPHLIELLNRDYTSVFSATLMDTFEDDVCPWIECKTLMTAFDDARKSKAMEQLQGQIASARIPLARFSSPAIFWALSGNDFTLDLNNPKKPKFVCIGNDPDREQLYSTTHSLITSRVFREINHPGRLRSAVLLDEMPTIRLKDVDHLVAVARSNKVAIVMGAQDKSQLVRDYTEKDANVVFNTVGNYLCGQVNGSTAKDLSQMFGKEFREKVSETQSDNGTSINTSTQMEEILPSYVIENLSTGTFFGRTQDVFKNKLNKKLFCGEIQIDTKAVEERKKNKFILPRMDHGAFKDEQIVESIRKNPEQACLKYMKDEFRRERKRNENTVHYDENGVEIQNASFTDFEISKIIKAKYDKLSEAEKKEMIEKCCKVATQKEIDRVLKENYMSIKVDLNEFFDSVGFPNGKVVIGVESNPNSEVINYQN